jgi:mannose-6-phosphate isomerase
VDRRRQHHVRRLQRPRAVGRRRRLPVHYHPGRAFARAAFGLDHGKTESWIILEAEPEAMVWVGFNRPVELATVKEWVRSQDGDEMLAALNPVPVSAGDAILVPGGTPHAIGAGILLVELQEPTDLSLALEYRSFGLSESEASLGLDWDRALEALDRSAWDAARLAAARKRNPAHPGASLLPPAADPYFRAELVRGGDTLDAGFSVLIGLGGEGALGGEPVGRGSALLIPHAAGALELTGDAEAIRCRPPAPNAPEGEW